MFSKVKCILSIFLVVAVVFHAGKINAQESDEYQVDLMVNEILANLQTTSCGADEEIKSAVRAGIIKVLTRNMEECENFGGTWGDTENGAGCLDLPGDGQGLIETIRNRDGCEAYGGTWGDTDKGAACVDLPQGFWEDDSIQEAVRNKGGCESLGGTWGDTENGAGCLDLPGDGEEAYLPLFEQIDSNGNNSISREEWRKYKKEDEPEVTSGNMKFRDIDENNNKEIGKGEFEKFYERLIKD